MGTIEAAKSLFSLLALTICFSFGTLVLFSARINAQSVEKLDELSARLESGTSEEKRDALQALARFRTESASRIAVAGLTDPEEIVQVTALKAIISLPKAEASGLLIPFLSSKSTFLRKEAVYSLGEIGEPTSAAELTGLVLRDRDVSVRSAAAIALGMIGDTDAIVTLSTLLTKKPKSAEAFLRRSAARSIGQIIERKTDGAISVATPESFLPAAYKSSQTAKADDSYDPKSFEFLVPILEKILYNKKETSDTKREAAFALGFAGGETAMKILDSFVSGSDPYLAEICREALLRLGSK